MRHVISTGKTDTFALRMTVLVGSHNLTRHCCVFFLYVRASALALETTGGLPGSQAVKLQTTEQTMQKLTAITFLLASVGLPITIGLTRAVDYRAQGLSISGSSLAFEVAAVKPTDPSKTPISLRGGCR